LTFTPDIQYYDAEEDFGGIASLRGPFVRLHFDEVIFTSGPMFLSSLHTALIQNYKPSDLLDPYYKPVNHTTLPKEAVLFDVLCALHNADFTYMWTSKGTLSRLVVQKLLYFLMIVHEKNCKNRGETSVLRSTFDNFWALPYGHVESDVLTSLNNKDLIEYSGQIQVQIHSKTSYPTYISESINCLKEWNPHITFLDEGQLIERSRSLPSWIETIRQAYAHDKRAAKISQDLINKDLTYI
jgi:hypothetical protein